MLKESFAVMREKSVCLPEVLQVQKFETVLQKVMLKVMPMSADLRDV